MIYLWTDGSFKCHIGWAFVAVLNGNVIEEQFGSIKEKECDPLLYKKGSVAAEMKAAMEAAKFANGRTATVCYDYSNIAKWPLRQCRVNDPFTGKYAQYMRKSGVQFKKVKSHSGLTHNERADHLAGEAAKSSDYKY